MTDQDQIDGLLDMVDDSRAEDRTRSEKLVILGYAIRRGRGYWPSQAGWNFLGDLGRPFDTP